MNDILAYLASLIPYNPDHPLLITQIHFWVLFFIVYVFFTLIVSYWRHRGEKSPFAGVLRRVFRNGYLFFFSLFFYYKTHGNFVGLLIFSTFLGWWLGIDMY